MFHKNLQRIWIEIVLEGWKGILWLHSLHLISIQNRSLRCRSISCCFLFPAGSHKLCQSVWGFTTKSNHNFLAHIVCLYCRRWSLNIHVSTYWIFLLSSHCGEQRRRWNWMGNIARIGASKVPLAPKHDIQINSIQRAKQIINGFKVDGKRFTFHAEDHNKIINLVTVQSRSRNETSSDEKRKTVAK